MKRHISRYMGFILIPALLFLLTHFRTTPVYAFHGGGVGNCNACHAVHSVSTSNRAMLRQTDPSSVCLNCHAGSSGPNSPSVFSNDGSAFTPGGDFYWLTRNYSWLDGSSPGHDHGHNIVAFDYNLYADPVLTLAPGGSFPSAQLGCTSCHDPHGRVQGGGAENGKPVSESGSYGAVAGSGAILGNYRLLGDSLYQPYGGSRFQHDAPVARQNHLNPFLETDQNHVDYGSGMSAWCGNCHSGIVNSEHRAGGGGFSHPTQSGEPMNSDQIIMYNSYVKSGDFSGIAATAYLQFVPFERGVDDVQQLDPNSTAGPGANAAIMCLTCHRAHASAFPNAGRWDFTATQLIDSHPAATDVGATDNDVINSYYGRDISTEFGAGQGAFCEKCHGAALPN